VTTQARQTLYYDASLGTERRDSSAYLTRTR
jgi:hypothetical protein